MRWAELGPTGQNDEADGMLAVVPVQDISVPRRNIHAAGTADVSGKYDAISNRAVLVKARWQPVERSFFDPRKSSRQRNRLGADLSSGRRGLTQRKSPFCPDKVPARK